MQQAHQDEYRKRFFFCGEMEIQIREKSFVGVQQGEWLLEKAKGKNLWQKKHIFKNFFIRQDDAIDVLIHSL